MLKHILTVAGISALFLAPAALNNSETPEVVEVAMDWNAPAQEATVDQAKAMIYKGSLKGDKISGDITLSVKNKKTVTGNMKGMRDGEKWLLGISGTVDKNVVKFTGKGKQTELNFEGDIVGKIAIGWAEGKINGKPAYFLFRATR